MGDTDADNPVGATEGWFTVIIIPDTGPATIAAQGDVPPSARK